MYSLLRLFVFIPISSEYPEFLFLSQPSRVFLRLFGINMIQGQYQGTHRPALAEAGIVKAVCDLPWFIPTSMRLSRLTSRSTVANLTLLNTL